MDACIPDNDPVRLISQFVEEMDLAALYDTYERMPSEKYVSPEIMLKIMLYAYHERKELSPRTIEKNCKRDINYMYLLKADRLLIKLPSQDSGQSTLENVRICFYHR